MVKVILQLGISSTFLHNALTFMFTNTCKVTTCNVLIHSPGNSLSSFQKLSVGIKIILISPVSLVGP